jgi:hypothetical protein
VGVPFSSIYHCPCGSICYKDGDLSYNARTQLLHTCFEETRSLEGVRDVGGFVPGRQD